MITRSVLGGRSNRVHDDGDRGSNDMQCGPSWIVFEASYHRASKKLLSLISSRRAPRDVAWFLEQLYVSRYASFHEHLAYKKSRKNAAYPVELRSYRGVLHCGHDPFLVAVRAHSVEEVGGVLRFSYRILVSSDTDFPLFEDREQTLELDPDASRAQRGT